MRVLLAALLVIVAGTARAQDAAVDASTSTAKLPSDISSQRKDIDEEITNAKLRASTGSKKLWSIQSEFDYDGGSIQDPFSPTRPKLTPGTVGNDPVSKIAGLVSVKYRATDHDNLNLGVGVSWAQPLRQGQYGQAENPYLTYTRLFKAGPFENVISIGPTVFTNHSIVNDQKLVTEGDASWQVLYTVGQTKLQIGAYLAYAREVYSDHIPKSQDPLTQSDKTGSVSDQLDADPFLEYALSDTFTIRTVCNWYNFTNTVAEPHSFTRDLSAQSLGIGISVSRDVYLYPNVQWIWPMTSADRTNVAITANINL